MWDVLEVTHEGTNDVKRVWSMHLLKSMSCSRCSKVNP